MAEAENIETDVDTDVDADAAKAADTGADKAADDGKGDAGGKDVAPSWPGDWREKLAGGDEKELARLKRFNSLADLHKSWRAADQRINSDEFIPKLPKDATDDQIAAYRKKVGIPEKPEGYLDNLSDGLNIGDADKPILDSFLKSAHGKNLPPEAVDAAVQWWYGELGAQQEALGEHDANTVAASEDELRSEWGDEYRVIDNHVTSWLDTAPEGVKEFLLNARGPDGTIGKANANVRRWLANMANEVSPRGLVVAGEGGTAKSIEDRLGEIAKYRRENRDKYYKDDKVLAEERRLLEAQERMKARSA